MIHNGTNKKVAETTPFLFSPLPPPKHATLRNVHALSIQRNQTPNFSIFLQLLTLLVNNYGCGRQILGFTETLRST